MAAAAATLWPRRLGRNVQNAGDPTYTMASSNMWSVAFDGPGTSARLRTQISSAMASRSGLERPRVTRLIDVAGVLTRAVALAAALSVSLAQHATAQSFTYLVVS